MEKKIIGTVPYTTRQLVQLSDGRELQRQMVYMDDESWKQLRDLCKEQHIGTSRVIAQLVNKAHQEWWKAHLN